jgi:hypothetical protein
MEQQQENSWEDPNRLTEPIPDRAPNRLTWPFKRVYWAFEKHVLWPVSDTFRRKPDFREPGDHGPADPYSGPQGYPAGRRRSPLAYVAVTLLVALAGGATAAAVYFHDQAAGDDANAVTAEVPATPDSTLAPVPQTTPPETGASSTPSDETLQGVVPNFETSAGQSSGSGSGGSGAGNAGSGSAADRKAANGKNKSKALVKPAPPPKSGPLKVAHNFALTFTGYEIGKNGAAKKFSATATPELAKELRRNPPKQPDGGEVPRATVMNVVKGQKDGRLLLVSVSLRRSGSTSELRLGMKRVAKGKGKKSAKKAGWRVSEVRG